jgi:hypothetical protein
MKVLYGKNIIQLCDLDPNLFLDEIGHTNELSLRYLKLSYSSELRNCIAPLRTAFQRFALIPDLQVRLSASRSSMPVLHYIASSVRMFRDLKRGNFVVTTEDIYWEKEDATWIIDEEEPWGFDYEKRTWVPFREIMTWELVERHKKAVQTERLIKGGYLEDYSYSDEDSDLDHYDDLEQAEGLDDYPFSEEESGSDDNTSSDE